MDLYNIDIAIIFTYLVLTVLIGFWISKRASKDLDSYFLGGKSLPWYILGISNASGQFDITGTMWLVYLCFVYGLKSVWIPWVWPTFNQIFLMVYVGMWLRRSNVLTGAEWIKTRFGSGTGANLAHISVVIFALINVIGMIAYAFKGIGKFAQILLPWSLHENTYALIILTITTLYVVKGGMYSVVLTEVLQFIIMTIASITVGVIAIHNVSPEMIDAVVPAGWQNLSFGWRLDLNWSGAFDMVQSSITKDGFSLFTVIMMLMLFKGVMASMAGPAPNYDMQRVLATRSPREASLMSATVNVVLYFPRYMLVAGLTILALGPLRETLQGMWTTAVQEGVQPDFEQILPVVIQSSIIPVGLTGLLLAGLLAAFMSTFAATVNAGPAYIVNDIYKRFINPTASNKLQILMSYATSVLVVAVGIVFGFLTESITEVTLWIVGGLYGGYVAANLLKWHWWRFNGFGFFYGMIIGTLGALVVPPIVKHFWPGTNTLYAFPAIFLFSVLGCFLGTLLSKPEDEEILKDFYMTVRPWGFWKPIVEKIKAEDPGFEPNTDCARHWFNVAVGIIWQITLVALPVYIVIQNPRGIAGTLAILLATTLILKKSWFDHLPSDK
ncbi:MAG TPA: sodium:solute symporter family protein [Sedimentisphaerales bacterium]|nr:sodium:solute symporter family protein [Sedimentisphaerales bacterium]